MISSIRSASTLKFAAVKISLPVVALIVALGLLGSPQRLSAQTTYTGGGAISILATGSQSKSSTLSVTTGVTGPVAHVKSVTLNGVTTNGSDYSMLPVTIMLTDPSGSYNMVLLGATGDGSDNGGLSSATIVINDTGSAAAPNSNPWSTSGGTVAPSSYWISNVGTNPNLGTSADWPQTDGSASLDTQFVGATATGNWKLTIANGDGFSNPIAITSWSMTLTYSSAIGTTTTLSSPDPSLTGNSVTFTATVKTSGAGEPTGTVAFTNNGSTISGCSAVSLTTGSAGSNQSTAQCSTTFATQGYFPIKATYTATGSFSSGSTNYSQLVEVTPTQSGDKWCNGGSVSVPGGGIPAAYPVIIPVSGYTPSNKTVSNVTVYLNGLTGTNGIAGQFLLVAPGGANNLDFLDEGFSESNASNINLVMFDTAGQSALNNEAPASGNYEATDNDIASQTFAPLQSPAVDSGIPSVPGTINIPQPEGGTNAFTFAQAFNNAPANGDWALYIYSSEALSLTGWCVDLTLNTGVTSTTTVTSNHNPTTTGTGTTFTATVTTGTSTPVTSGSVTFEDNGATPAGTVSGNNVVPLNGSGQATFTTSSLTEGDHKIQATFGGSSGANPSNGFVWQRYDNTTTAALSSGVYSFCNAGGVLTAQGQSGAFYPNPSIVTPFKLPGEISAVTLTLDNFYTESDAIYEIESMVEGPTGAALDFFSDPGLSNTVLAEGNYKFSDGSSLAPQGAFGAGTYGPTSYDTGANSGGDVYTAESGGFYTLPGSFGYAAPRGTSTFASKFGGTSGIGTWSLYFNQTEAGSAAGAVNGWCLNFTETQPTVTATAGHSGSFIQGQPNQTITADVMNNGTGPTGDPDGTAPLVVTDTLDSHFTYAGVTGSGWTCVAGPPVTCKNDSVIAQGSSFPTLNILVNVAGNASGSINNSFGVAGDGIAQKTSNTDSIPIEDAAILSVTKTDSGHFTQGQGAEWDIVVANTAANGSTYGNVSVSDTLPSGYSVSSFGSTTGWSCSGTTSVSCTSTTTEPGGSSFPTIQLQFTIPYGSPTSVSNTALAWGGGDLTHTNSGSAASGSDSNVPVAKLNLQLDVAVGDVSTGTPWSGTETAGASADGSADLINGTGGPVAGGTVAYTFFTGSGCSTVLSTSTKTLQGNGEPASSDTVGPLAAGNYSMSATYNGNADYNTSTSGCQNFTVNQAATSTGVTSNINPSLVGQTIMLTATISGGYQTSGTVSFTSDGSPISSCTGLNVSSNQAVCTTASLPSGNHAIVATYSGDGNNLGSVGSLSGGQQVNIPILVVTTANDDTSVPVATNCTAQTTPGTGTDSNCSLRDALAYSANAGAANISFDSTQFSTPQTITVGVDGTMTIPANTTISGPTSGSGYNLANLVTIDGAGTYQIFIATGTASLSDLTIQNGNNANGGAAFHHSGGTLTLTNCTIQSNAASTGNTSNGYGGAVQGPGSLTVNNCTFSGNNAGADGGAIFQTGGTLSIIDSTFANNSSQEAGAISLTGPTTGTITNSTFAGNSANAYGGVIENFGALTFNNNIVSNNTSGAAGAIMSRDDSTGTLSADSNVFYNNNNSTLSEVDISCGSGTCAGPSTVITNSTEAATNPVAQLASYGGSTQTMLPLPDSGALCSGTTNNAFNASVTADQRGFVIDPNCNKGQVDAGAVQASYVLTYKVQPPPNVVVGQPFAAEVHLTENGQAANPPTNTIAMSSSTTTLGGTTSANLNLSSATFLNLIYSTAASNDNLIATLPLNSSLVPPVNLTAQSSAINAYVAAALTSPTPLSTLAGPSVTFTWSPGTGATAYQLWVGSTGVNSQDLYSSGVTTGTSATVNNLPTSGGTIYVRLYSEFSGSWVHIDYTFTAATQAAITSPAASSTLAGPSVTFNWSPGSGATAYQLWVGSTGVNSQNIYSSGVITNTSATVSNLPTSGGPIYARLYVQFNGVWTHLDYTYTAATAAALTSPTPTTTLAGPSVAFNWTAGTATAFQLWVGSTGVNSQNLYSSGVTTNTSATVNSLPTGGGTIYVRLYAEFSGIWTHVDYTYTSASGPALTSPTPSSTLAGPSVTFTWAGGGGATAYQLWLGSTGVNSQNLYSSGSTASTSVTVNSLPTNGETVYARLYSLINGVWNHIDYTYTAASGPALTSPTPGSTLAGSTQTFQWSPGNGVTAYQLWLGSTGVNSQDLYSSGVVTGTSVTAHNLPTNGETIYARLYIEINGVWSHEDYTYTAQ